ncbi:MAG: patatin-like phospholipase family protein [Luteolibacter sp.]
MSQGPRLALWQVASTPQDSVVRNCNAWSCPVRSSDRVDPGMIYRWAPMVTFGRLTGILNGKRVIHHLRRELPVMSIEDAPQVNLKIAVTDLRRQQSVFLTRGLLAEAMMASCAVPLLFSEQTIDGTRFSDGGILHELPFEPLWTIRPSTPSSSTASVTMPLGGRR